MEGRSSSAAKKADALRRMAFALRRGARASAGTFPQRVGRDAELLADAA
jgi:hypothetical protein